MNAAILAAPVAVPKWKHCAPYFLVALALHLAVLTWPRDRALGEPDLAPPGQIMVRLVDEAPVPPAVHVPPAPPASSTPPQRERPQKAPRPILSMPASHQAAPAAFVVPAESATSPAPAPTVADNAGPATPPAFSPPHFNAAYLHNPAPVFPPMSRRLGEEGKVLLRVKVSPEGRPVAVDVEKGSNFERLDEAARATVARWRFVPARRGDEPVEGLVVVPIVFRLDE